jgi:hypothetical protein
MFMAVCKSPNTPEAPKRSTSTLTTVARIPCEVSLAFARTVATASAPLSPRRPPTSVDT